MLLSSQIAHAKRPLCDPFGASTRSVNESGFFALPDRLAHPQVRVSLFGRLALGGGDSVLLLASRVVLSVLSCGSASFSPTLRGDFFLDCPVGFPQSTLRRGYRLGAYYSFSGCWGSRADFLNSCRFGCLGRAAGAGGTASALPALLGQTAVSVAGEAVILFCR